MSALTQSGAVSDRCGIAAESRSGLLGPAAPGWLVGWRWWLACLLVTLAGVLPLVVRNDQRLPIEKHEILVARAAQEAMDSGEHLIPTYNGQPRLKKPPLSTWLTVAAARFLDSDKVIEEWEARLPNVLAAGIWTVITVALGSMLISRPVGLLSGLLLAGSAAYSGYANNARPDLLYSVLCSAGLLGFVAAWRWSEQEAPPWQIALARWGGWLPMTVASLAKGPHVQLMFLAIFLLFLWTTGRRSHLRQVFGPALGLPVFVVGSAWWFIIVAWSVPQAGEVFFSEVAMRFEEDTTGRSWFYPYYVVEGIKLSLPWTLLLLPIVFAPLWRPFRQHGGAMLLWTICVVVALIFQALIDRHRHYLLPIWGMLAILAATQLLLIGQTMVARQRPLLWALVLAALAAAPLAGVAAAAMVLPEEVRPPSTGVGGMLLAGGVGTLLALWAAWRRKEVISPSIFVGTLVVAFSTVMTINGSMWTIERFRQREAAMKILTQLPPDAAVVAPHSAPVDYVIYYGRRIIGRFDQTKPDKQLVEQMLKASSPLYILLSRPHRFEGDHPASMLLDVDTLHYGDPNAGLRLYRIDGEGTASAGSVKTAVPLEAKPRPEAAPEAESLIPVRSTEVGT